MLSGRTGEDTGSVVSAGGQLRQIFPFLQAKERGNSGGVTFAELCQLFIGIHACPVVILIHVTVLDDDSRNPKRLAFPDDSIVICPFASKPCLHPFGYEAVADQPAQHLIANTLSPGVVASES